MTIIFTCISVSVLLIYVLNLVIMLKKGKNEKKTQTEEFADDHIQRKGIQAICVSFFNKIKL
jgi:hypothetical protein